METLSTVRRAAACARPAARGATVGLVPTMGALHAGHAALFAAARAECDVVVASLFRQRRAVLRPGRPRRVPARSRARRAPRRRARRRLALRAVAPPSSIPPGFATWVEPAGVAEGLEGEHRPGHFRGVATVCMKLFTIVRPAHGLLRPQGRPAGRGRQASRARPQPRRSRSASFRPSATTTGSRSRPATGGFAPRSAPGRSRSPAPSRRATRARPRASLAEAGDRARLRRRRRPRRADPRGRRPDRLDAPDRQRPPGRRAAMSTRPRTPARAAPHPASCRCPSSGDEAPRRQDHHGHRLRRPGRAAGGRGRASS